MKRFTPILTLILITILLIHSCKEDDELLIEPIQISIPKDELKSFELALIEVNTNLESQQSYSGFIDSESITFKPNGNYLIFQVPTGPLGAKSGSVTINDEDFNFQYELVTNSFTDPESYLQNYFDEQQIIQTELENLQDDFIEDGIPGFEDIQADLTSWAQISNIAQVELAALSIEDKEQLAKLIDANSEWIQRLDDRLLFKSIYSMNNRTSVTECRALIEQGRIELQEGRTFAAAGTSVQAYWCSLTFDERQYDELENDFERGGLLSTDIEFTAGLDVLNTLANLVFRKMDAITKELQGSISSNGVAEEIEEADYNRSISEIPFGNGVPEELFAKIRFRSINEEDVNTSGAVGEAATFFDQVITSYNDMVMASNQPLIWRPGFTQSSVIRNFNQFLTIPASSISNSDIVLINTQYVNDKWEVAFGNDGDEEEPTFSFELNYDDGYIQLNKTVDARIGIETCIENVTYSSFTDTRDNYIYKTININGQVWFAENLRYAGDGIGSTEFYTDEQIALYGRRYTAFDMYQEENPICPIGWHVPSNDEWNTLIQSTGIPESELGTALKDCESWNGTNIFGLSLLPGGHAGNFEIPTGSFGSTGNFWTSTSAMSTSGRTYSRFVRTESNEIGRESSLPYASICVRCLQD